MRTAVPSPRALRGRTAIAAVVALLAALIVSASPAAAASVCPSVTDPGDSQGNIVVQLNHDDPGGVDTLTMSNGVLFLNGVSCGTPSGVVPAVTIIDIGTAKADTLVIDLSTGPFRVGGAPLFIGLNLDEGEGDSVEIRGTSGVDIATISPAQILVAQTSNFSGAADATQLRVDFSGEFAVEFSLEGSADQFDMVAADGAHFAGDLTVNGGDGADALNGGPGAQTLNGDRGGDTINGGSGPDIINGNGGADELNGNGGGDIISGGRGGDTINGGNGPDTINGNGGGDELNGNGGGDSIIGGNGRDAIRGGKGADTISASGGKADNVHGNGGRDSCECGSEDTVRSIENLS